MKFSSQHTTFVSVLALGLVAAGCGQEGPAEKTGKQIDQAVEETADKLRDTLPGLPPEGPMEKAGKSMDQAVENMGEKAEELGDKIKEETAR